MKVKQRDIILIKFPFSDLSGAKVRPALVISNNQYNQKKRNRPREWKSKRKEKIDQVCGSKDGADNPNRL